MIVYIVTIGVRTERKIKAVFEDRDQAVYCCAICDREDAQIEEWDTEGITISGNKKPLGEWAVYINTAGVAIDADVRYTFTEIKQHSRDVDGSYIITLTLPLDVSEDKAKEIALDYWRQLEKKKDE